MLCRFKDQSMQVNPEVFDQALEKVDSPSFSFSSFHSLFSTLYALPFSPPFHSSSSQEIGSTTN